MDHTVHNQLISFIWSIADDCLRDVYVRGKYRDVILPMFVLRRLDCLLEDTNGEVLEQFKVQTGEPGVTALESERRCDPAGYRFYNTSPWTLQKLVDTSANNRQSLEVNFKAYLDGFSANIKEIIEKFELRNQIKRMVELDVLRLVLEKFVDPHINLSTREVTDPEGRKLPPLTNHGMGVVFEELIRKFNEENNEEAGEHFTPREVIKLMIHLLFLPVKDQLPPVLTIYDCACGSGGMLTESEGFLNDPDGLIHSNAAIHLYGKEVNGETYAICKSDMMIKGNDPKNIRFGSTLAMDEFSGMTFDFMLSNPPYGKSWKADQSGIFGDKKEVLDPRFEVRLKNFKGVEERVPAIPRSSDGQLLFLVDMVSKMKPLSQCPLGSRIASIHNGSSLFTGDAGSGESNIRRYIIENDWLEAIIQLPRNLFYNTGISTYIWILSNHKAPHRQGQVQLIDASDLYRKLRKNLGAKNCEFAPEHIEKITWLYQEMVDQPYPSAADRSLPSTAPSSLGGKSRRISKVFENRDFGYYKVTVERPLRLAAQLTSARVASLRYAPALQEPMAWAYDKWGEAIYNDLANHKKGIEDYIKKEALTLSPKNRKILFTVKTWTTQKFLMEAAEQLMAEIGQAVWMDFNAFSARVDETLKNLKIKLSASEKKQILNAVTCRDEKAARVVKKVHRLRPYKLGDLLAELGATAEQLSDYGYWLGEEPGQWIEYEVDSELRDTENVPLSPTLSREERQASQVIHEYFLREVRPHAADAWIALDKTQIGYEISFNKYFYQHKPLRSLEAVTAEILQLEQETEGLLKRLVSFGDLPHGG